ncbi:hypothetical protein GGI04_001568 [Coemansia thaxteri]|nr:hypothetical protein GGI04_001568 [Coemansia thaxteri]
MAYAQELQQTVFKNILEEEPRLRGEEARKLPACTVNPGLLAGVDVRNMSVMSRIYVGSINFELNDEQLKRVFSEFGSVCSVSMSKDPATGRHKGFGFIEYDVPEAATLAMEVMNGTMLGGRQLKIGRPNNYSLAVTQGFPAPPAERIYVANVNEAISEDVLREIFAPFGQVNACVLAVDIATRKHKGWGFIEFAEEAPAEQAALAMNGFSLGNLVDLSPEEYFRHHAAAALLHSEGDAPDDAKEAWSDIDDVSAGHAGANGIYAAAAPPDHEYYQYGYGGHPAPAAGAPGSVKPAYAAGSGHEHHRRYYDAGVGDYASYQASADQKQPPPPAHQSKISDLLMQPSADSYAQDGRASSGRHPSAYYDTGAHAAATLGHSATALGKHDMAAVDYDAAPSKRQRMAQSSTTWPAAASLSYGSHHAQAYSAANVESDGRHSVDPAAAVRSYGYGHHSDYHQKHSASQVPSATYAPGTHQQQYHQAPGDQRAAYQYGQQHYRQQQQPPPPPQHGYHHRQSASSSAAAYYGTPAAKYDYASDAPASYYQRRPHQGSAGTGGAPPPVASGVSGAVPQHKQVYYNSADGTYYRSASTTHYQQQHQQQHQLQQVVAGARSSDPYYSYNQSATASAAAAAAAAGYTSQQHQPGSEYAGGWSDYYQQSQQYANQPPGASGQPSAHQRYPQEPRASASRAGTQHGTEYYESNGYYAGSHPQRTAAPDAQMYYPGTGENGGDPRRYPTLPNLLK